MKLTVLLFALGWACFTASAWLSQGPETGLFIAGFGLLVVAGARAAAWSEGLLK